MKDHIHLIKDHQAHGRKTTTQAYVSSTPEKVNPDGNVGIFYLRTGGFN
jgi:hypothetical protein